MTFAAVLATVFVIAQAAQPPAARIDNETCLSCHGDATLSLKARDGATVSLRVPQDTLTASVHAKVACVDCHTAAAELPHPERSFGSRREMTLTLDEQCRRCHFANYTKTLDSVHQQAVARGDRTAPVCVDCHGSHDVKKSSTPRTVVSQTCARCHEGIATAYAGSVHGRALKGGNQNAPVCTDCHHAHDVAGPKQTAWELRTPEMCGSCHANKFTTYLSDFHGKTASLRRHQNTAATGPVVARCTDCHGVHDIQKATDPQSPVIKANLLTTCRQCHPGATDNFPAAWLSHYEPSLHQAQFVYAVKLGYAVLIPFMIGGLGLQILLHLWRLMANR
jgi:predicted CXXCH cytochrome family protein